jgi:hypothetical protein
MKSPTHPFRNASHISDLGPHKKILLNKLATHTTILTVVETLAGHIPQIVLKLQIGLNLTNRQNVNTKPRAAYNAIEGDHHHSQ